VTSANTPSTRATTAAELLRTLLPRTPDVAVVLGSGLGGFVRSLDDPVTIPYDRIPGWPISGVVGHEGRLVVGHCRGRLVAALAGRCHRYEGHDLATVTLAVRTLGVLGVGRLILTNAAGGINLTFVPGTLMVIDDHINLMGDNPLVGPNDERLGPRFPDMTEVYATHLRGVADEAARSSAVTLCHGVYAALLGPSYETPAEIRYLRTIGADAVGMSTVPEAIAARHMRMDVLGISCISNMAAGVQPTPLRHQDVMDTAARVSRTFVSLLEGIVGRL
jgi:purine-nucleoside phosphorylase